MLELGCGTGRVTLPLARAGVPRRRRRSLGADAGARAAARPARARLDVGTSTLVRGDIRALPFRRRRVRAGDGAVRHPAVAAARARSRRDARRGRARARSRAARSASSWCADLPVVEGVPEAGQPARLARRRGGAHVTLVESVRQDRARSSRSSTRSSSSGAAARRATHRFALTFRTLSVPQMTRRLEQAGFEVIGAAGRLPRRAVGSRAPTCG